MKHPRTVLGTFALACFVTTSLLAQTAPPTPTPGAPGSPQALAFGQFLNRVGTANLDLAAQRTNVSIAEAQLAIARIFPDPVLTAGIASIDPSMRQTPPASLVQLTVPIELGNKLAARVRVADVARQIARLQIEDFLRGLRADAANAFVDTLHAQLVLERRARTYADLQQLTHINEERLRVGDVGEVAVIQSRVEAERFHADVITSQGELRASQIALRTFLGAVGEASVNGELRIPSRHFDDAQLVASAVNERPDVRAAVLAVTSGEARVRLAEANRWVDLAVNLGWQHNFNGTNTTADTPSFEQFSATLSVPLPFSRIYRGELDAARFTQAQAETQLRGIRLRAEVEVRAALARYDATVARLDVYNGTLVSDAERVLAATLYTYQHGGATLLEVLNAQRTVDQLYIDYFDTLSDHAKRLVAVEQAAGLWDVTF